MTLLVSILIPACDAAPWIGETLDSALGQTYPRCEIIVVDDGSTDGTLARARAFEARGVRVFTQPNAGASAARNHALRLARGEFIQFLDADDLLSPGKIAAQIQILAALPSGAVAHCRWGRFHDSPEQTAFADDDLARNFEPVEWLRLHCAANRMIHPAAWLTPRALADRAGPWNETLTLNDDGEYFSRIVLAATQLVCAPFAEAQSHYRSGLPGSLSRRRSAASLQSLYRSIELVSARLIEADHTPETRRALAIYWRRLQRELILDAPALAEVAAQHVEILGGAPLGLEAHAVFRTIARGFGLRTALRLQRLLRSLPTSASPPVNERTR